MCDMHQTLKGISSPKWVEDIHGTHGIILDLTYAGFREMDLCSLHG